MPWTASPWGGRLWPKKSLTESSLLSCNIFILDISKHNYGLPLATDCWWNKNKMTRNQDKGNILNRKSHRLRVDEDAKWKTNELRQMHTAQSVCRGRKPCQNNYIFLSWNIVVLGMTFYSHPLDQLFLFASIPSSSILRTIRYSSIFLRKT